PHAQAADAQAGIDVPTAEGPDGELPARLRDIVGLARRRLLEAEDPADWARLVAALAAMGLREAHPRTWSTWFQVSSDAPAHAAADAVRIRPSEVERCATCPPPWFLVDAGGGRGDTAAATMGTAVHAIAEHHTAPDRAAMMQEFLDTFDLEQVPSAWEREA